MLAVDQEREFFVNFQDRRTGELRLSLKARLPYIWVASLLLLLCMTQQTQGLARLEDVALPLLWASRCPERAMCNCLERSRLRSARTSACSGQ